MNHWPTGYLDTQIDIRTDQQKTSRLDLLTNLQRRQLDKCTDGQKDQATDRHITDQVKKLDMQIRYRKKNKLSTNEEMDSRSPYR